MHQGNWKCSTCGGAITELPFQPRSESGLTCRTCYGKSKGSSNGGGGSSSSDDNSLEESAPTEMSMSAEAPYDIPEDADLAGEQLPEDDGLDAVPVTPGEKQRIEGNWICAGCGEAITSLPFNPRDTSNLKCIDCFKRSRE